MGMMTTSAITVHTMVLTTAIGNSGLAMSWAKLSRPHEPARRGVEQLVVQRRDLDRLEHRHQHERRVPDDRRDEHDRREPELGARHDERDPLSS